MTAAVAPCSFVPSLALLEALARLVESDPESLAKATTVTECDRDDAVAHQLGELLATVHDDPRTRRTVRS